MDGAARRRAPIEAESLSEPELGSEATIRSMMPSSDSAPRREHSRFSVDLDVTVGSDHNFYAGFAENLSAGGVFIATHKLKPVGSKIELSINLPDGVQLKTEGEVRWIRVFNEHSDTPPGMGVKFNDLPASSVAAIQNFLARRDPLFFDDE
ncbi:MAG TPA: TIGR02266 family protein [Polyangiaceae bacterium]|nr:TIGR02266 family protein [Polyangiaceae bacterium]